MEFRVGCSGYYYPQWKDKLYPKGVATKNWLAYYSTKFNTVELNGTFYRQPKITDLKKYVTVTSNDFTFSVKMSRYITHVQRLKVKQTIDEFQDLILQGLEHKLQYFLFQMPPNYLYSKENLEVLINSIPHSSRNVIEFRNISWWNDSVQKALMDANISFCNVDFPGLESWFIHTTSNFYLRLHGSPKLFVSSYSKPKLEGFYRDFPQDTGVSSIYFNNTVTEAGFNNALQLKKIIGAKLLTT